MHLDVTKRGIMLDEGVVVFNSEKLKSMRKSTLEDLVKYYEDVLELIGGKEIFVLLEHLAAAEHELIEKNK